MSNLAELLIKNGLSILGTAIGGPLGGAAVEFLASKLGTDKTAEAVHETLSGMKPEQIVELKKLDVEFQKFMAENGIKIDLAQIDVDKEEAKSTNWFVAGWRPATGWICNIVLFFAFVPKALVLTSFWAYEAYLTLAHPGTHIPALPDFPDIGITDVLGILGTLLGASWMAKLRTDEKVAGVHNDH